MRFLIQGLNADGPTYEREADSFASVGGHIGQMLNDHETLLVFRIIGDTRQLVLRYDQDGYDL